LSEDGAGLELPDLSASLPRCVIQSRSYGGKQWCAGSGNVICAADDPEDGGLEADL